ncbi:DUF4062 domain-containing protein [Bradyrhizobium sp. LCT2]|uniref:DUF4062 domain-containing protein n=1 Tax=Bradyrhizobium sp. LCT2 TaxID=2493093 RepID=UPI0013741040|nr:DUF4062 domain-containing protein [Bradyrhizobium sp. LCT2]QHP69995.1 DUF4062 domain-containing protein [Bradyrhizobium sp. LCT2]
MAENVRKVVKVFLASPGDLGRERSLAKEAVDEINETIGRTFGYHVDLIGWEDTVSAYGRPQALINKEVEQCEYFIGLMWKRWGTPPDSEGRFTSGFEEEFELALSRRSSEGKPEISMFFKEIPSDKLDDPGTGLQRVLEFRKQMITEKRVLFEDFKTEDDYQKKLRRALFRYLSNLRATNETSPDDSSVAPSAGQTSSKDAPTEGMLSTSALSFLERIAAVAKKKKHIEPFDLARFRLIGQVLHQQGNDEDVMGVHDANLIFRYGDIGQLGPDEVTALADCGLRNISSQTAPLWQWVAHRADIVDFLSLGTFLGSEAVRRGSFRAMTLIKAPLYLDNRGDHRQRRRPIQCGIRSRHPELHQTP